MLKLTDKKFKNIIEKLDEATISDRLVFFSKKSPDRFLIWWFYYFSHEFSHTLAPFHYNWIESFLSDKNLLIKWFRWSIKTSVTLAYATYCIANKFHSFIVWQSYESSASSRNTTQIALKLMNKKLERDYWVIFSPSWNRDELEKRSVWDFDTKNWVKVLSASLLEKLRWAVSRWERPDLLILDDIDITDSVRNVEVINKNYDKLTGETIWALSKENSRIIFLWNVIWFDWLVPRFENEKRNDKNWDIYSQSIYDEKWNIAWDFITPEMIVKIKSNEWERAFSQNYLLDPIVLWELFFADQSKIYSLDYTEDSKFNDIRIYRPPKEWLLIWVDTSWGWWWDYSTVSVRDIAGNLYLFYRWYVPPDILHDEIIDHIFTLGYRWRLGIESNNTGIATITKARAWKWKNYLYFEMSVDERTQKPRRKLWWNTNVKTRSLMLSEMEEAIRTWQITEVDQRERDEMRTFVYSEDFKPEASAQCHDDCIIWDAICWQMRKYPVPVSEAKEDKKDPLEDPLWIFLDDDKEEEIIMDFSPY